VRLLLDTQIVLWSVDKPDELTGAERDLISAPDCELVVSVVSLWEIRIKIRAIERRVQASTLPDPAHVIAFYSELGARIAPLNPSTLTISLHPPVPHADPFDEILLVHAGELGARLLTRDRHLRNHPLAYQS